MFSSGPSKSTRGCSTYRLDCWSPRQAISRARPRTSQYLEGGRRDAWRYEAIAIRAVGKHIDEVDDASCGLAGSGHNSEVHSSLLSLPGNTSSNNG